MKKDVVWEEADFRQSEDGETFADGRFEEEEISQTVQAPDLYAQPTRTVRRDRLLLLLLIFLFGIPIAVSAVSAGFSILTGVIGGVIGIFGGLFGLIAGGAAAAAGLAAAGIWMAVWGICNMALPEIGLMLLGGGFLMICIAFLLAALVYWGCVTAVRGLFRLMLDLGRRLAGWLGRCAGKIAARMSGRGGEPR